MKIVHLNTYAKGGAAKAALRLHQGLLDQGINSWFLYTGKRSTGYSNAMAIPSPKYTYLARALNKINFPVTSSHRNIKMLKHLKGEYEIITFPETDFRIEELEIIKDADVIHLHWVSNFVNFPSFFKYLMHKPIVWTLHDMNPFMGVFHYQHDCVRNQIEYEKVNRYAIDVKLNALHKVKNLHYVCLCNWMKEYAKNSEILRPFSSSIIPNGINFKDFQLIPKTIAKKELNLPLDKIILLFLTENLNNHRKGGDIFLKALQLLTNTDNIFIVLVGSNTKKDFLNNIKAEVKVFEHIDSTKDLSKIYSASDLFILPSREDNLPNTMLEAFACGTPVLSFDNGGMRDWIIEGLNGGISQASPAELAASIAVFLKKKDSFDSQKIRNFAFQNFNIEDRAIDFINLYKSIIRQ